MASRGQGFDRDEFADTTELTEPMSSTADYRPDWPFGLQPGVEDDIARPDGQRRPGSLPTRALATGALMAIVPFAVAVALFLWIGSPSDSRSQEDAAGLNNVDRADSAVNSAADSAVSDADAGEGIPREPTESGPSSSTTVSTSTTEPTSSTSPSSVTTADTIRPGDPPAGPVAAYPNPVASRVPAGSGCTPGPGSLPDGTWFGSIAGWTENEVSFDLYCLFGGPAAIDAAASRNETVRAGTSLYAVNDNNTIRSVPVSSGARVRNLLSPTGAARPAVDWADAPGRLDTVELVSSRPGWLVVADGSVIEVAIMPRTLFQLSFPPPGDVEIGDCANNGLARATRLVVAGIPADDPDGGLNLRNDPSLDAGVFATVPNGTPLSLFLSCEISADDYRWWAVEYGGAVVWGASEFLRLS